jgi:transcriptional regulator with XRE-family HTH domain
MEIIDVGKRVAMLRKAKGWSQLELAEKLNVSDKTVSKWENGGMPGIDLFPKMAKLFGVSIDYLMTGDKEAESGNTVENSPPELFEDVPEKSIDLNLPSNYECPKCGKINPNPGTHCQYCFHSFIDDVEDVEDSADDEAGEVTEILCSKCGKINPVTASHCQMCYHEFTEEEKLSKRLPKKADNKVNRMVRKIRNACPNCGEVNVNASSGDKCSFCGWKLETQNSEYKTSGRDVRAVSNGAQSSSGCLVFFIAFLIPLFGLIFGAVKRDKGLIIFSLVFMFIEVIISIVLSILFFALSGFALASGVAGCIFVL